MEKQAKILYIDDTATARMLAANGATTGEGLNYANSGDVTGDRIRVVGYMAAALLAGPTVRQVTTGADTQANAAKPELSPAANAAAPTGVGTDLGVTAGEKKRLHQIARQSIEARLRGDNPPKLGNLTGTLKEMKMQEDIVRSTAEKVFAERKDRIDYLVGLQGVELVERLVVQRMLRQPTAEQQSQVVPHQRLFGVVQQDVERGRDRGRLAAAAHRHQIAGGRIGQGDRLRQAIEDVGADGGQLVLGPQGGDLGLGGVVELLPGEPLVDGGLDLGYRGRLPGGAFLQFIVGVQGRDNGDDHGGDDGQG